MNTEPTLPSDLGRGNTPSGHHAESYLEKWREFDRLESEKSRPRDGIFWKLSLASVPAWAGIGAVCGMLLGEPGAFFSGLATVLGTFLGGAVGTVFCLIFSIISNLRNEKHAKVSTVVATSVIALILITTLINS